MHLQLDPRRVARTLFLILAFLLVAHIAALLSIHRFDHDRVFGLVPLFHMGKEQNVPTLFATLLLLANAGFFFLLQEQEEHMGYRRVAWLLMAVIFAFLALDEFSEIHEGLVHPVRSALGVDGYLFFAWVIPYAIIAFGVALIVAPAVWSLDWRFRLLLALAGTCYVGGAVGFEMIGGHYLRRQTEIDLGYGLLQGVEESLEFIGLIVLSYALIGLIALRTRTLHLCFAADSSSGDDAGGGDETSPQGPRQIGR